MLNTGIVRPRCYTMALKLLLFETSRLKLFLLKRLICFLHDLVLHRGNTHTAVA